MSQTFKTPSQVADDYLTTLKGLRPDVNTAQTDSDWWIRSRVVGGVVSGVYADQLQISNDAFPQNARHDALAKFLDLYFEGTFDPATAATGGVIMSGVSGSYGPGLSLIYQPNGNTYTTISSVTLAGATGSGATGDVIVVSNGQGQNQNLLAGTVLTISSPPAGINPTATVDSGAIGGGRDPETDDQARTRILQRIREPIAGGKVSDYQQFAFDADPSVTSASVLRFPFGFGTVMVVFTAGTSDIDTAINEGLPIVQIPNQTLINKVQAYIDSQNPVTDCAYITGPNPKSVNVTVAVKYVTGNGSTVPANQLDGQSLTQDQLVIREIQRAIYKTPPGGRQIGPSGFVVAADMEQVLDLNLSGQPYVTAAISPILSDRQVSALSATGYDLAILGNELPQPGTITVIALT